ncbi:hypothetical protein [uncultured Tateyamaria sp.]|uniref:hypothetical protein n=1 Tax=uncultured Tateyamaria sp. TaxID=455651 RepID=UPI00262B9E37|nr:hypothetical protein [uncultured Tateyamaria sp.]
MTALRNTITYGGEYDFRQGFALETELPQYLEELVQETHAGLLTDVAFTSVTEIDQGADFPKYRLMMDISGMTLSIRFNGEEEDTRRAMSDFERLGGIRDILSGIVQGGGLPAELDPEHVTTSLD